MNEKTKENYQEIKSAIQSNKIFKVALFIGISAVSIFLLGKAFKGLASTVRSYNELKSAFNGQ